MLITRSTWLVLFALAVLSSLPPQVLAQGGPPLLTDDPGTPGNRHWEINLGFTVEQNRKESLFETPRVDFNYGWGDHIQLKFEIPWLHLSEDHMVRAGLGNSLIGVKWRFVDEERRGLAVSTYPQLEFNNPTSSAERGLVARGKRLLLPVEMSRRVGWIKLNWELGYRFAFVEPRSDEWLYGLAAGHQLNQRLELLGELHGTARRDFSDDELVFGLGGREKLAHGLVLLFTAGRGLRAMPAEKTRFLAYLGMQFNF